MLRVFERNGQRLHVYGHSGRRHGLDRAQMPQEHIGSVPEHGKVGVGDAKSTTFNMLPVLARQNGLVFAENQVQVQVLPSVRDHGENHIRHHHSSERRAQRSER